MDVLVVDDERALRSALRRALTLEGYRVLESESGERAIETLTERTVDAAILDVLMPGIDGLEICRRLRAGRPPSSTGRPPAGGGFGADRAPSQVAQKAFQACQQHAPQGGPGGAGGFLPAPGAQ